MTLTRSRIVAIVGILVLLFASQVFATTARAPRILAWDTMVGVPQDLTGAASQGPLRGISGGGFPWTLTEAHGYLTTSGHLKIEVEGLVLASGPLVGQNPIASFKGAVSCVVSDGTFDNIFTGTFPATTGFASAGAATVRSKPMSRCPTRVSHRSSS
jgi:hypothetical protein